MLVLAMSAQGHAASAWPDRYNDCLGMTDAEEAVPACIDALTSPALSVLERAEVYRRLGYLHRKREEIQQAESSLQSSLALVPDSPFTKAEFGAILYLKSDFKAAYEMLSEAIAGGASDSTAYNNRGMALIALGDVKSALRDLDVAISLTTDNGELWNNRANARCATGDVQGAYQDRIQALYNRRFTASAAQAGLRRSGFYSGPADGIWAFDSEEALLAWTEAGCPDAPASRLQ